jgi:HK97 family phage major capsid protein
MAVILNRRNLVAGCFAAARLNQRPSSRKVAGETLIESPSSRKVAKNKDELSSRKASILNWPEFTEAKSLKAVASKIFEKRKFFKEFRSIKMRTKREMQERLARLRVLEERNEATAGDLEEIRDLRNQIKNIGKRLIPPETGGQQQQSENRFASFGEFLQAAIRAETPGGSIDQRLLESRTASGLAETIPSEGGFLIDRDFSNDLLKSVFEVGKLGKLCQKIPISSDSNAIELNMFDETSRATGSRFGGIRTYWTDEASELTKSKPKFRKLKLRLNKLAGLIYLTEELMADVSVLETVVKRAFADEFAFTMDDMILRGTGAGQPLGILNAGVYLEIAKQSGQTQDTVVIENLVKMWSRFLGDRSKAVWLVNSDVIPSLYLMSIDGSGNSPVYVPSGGASQRPYNSLFGAPVIECESCSTLGDSGDVILADMSQYLLATKGGLKSAASAHVRFIFDELVLKFTMRWDSQPTMKSPVTPYKGSASKSPFIGIAERGA